MSTKALSNQEIFDKVVTHLRQQGRPAIDPGTKHCQYRVEDGTKCAVGCLLDEWAWERWGCEPYAVDELDPRVLWYSGVGPGQVRLLVLLQEAHDRSGTVSCLMQRLTKAANLYDLSHGLVDDWHLEATPEELGRVWRVA